MTISVAQETIIFFGCVACGMIIGLLFDIIRISRRIVKTSTIMTIFEDLIFWLISTSIVFVAIFYLNSGELRWYEFFGIFLGGMFYLVAFSNLILKVSVYVINFFKNLIIQIIKIIFVPFKWIFKILRKPFLFVINISKKNISRIKRKVLKNIRNCGKVIHKI